jgi:hypothetical protein
MKNQLLFPFIKLDKKHQKIEKKIKDLQDKNKKIMRNYGKNKKIINNLKKIL